MNTNVDYFGKELEYIRKSQEKFENSFSEMQADLKSLKSRMDDAEEWISDLEGRIIEITQSGHQTENQVKKHENNMRDLWDNTKWSDLFIIRVTEGEEKEKGIENIFEKIMAENFPNWKETDTKIQEARRAPNKLTKRAHTKTYYKKNGKS